MAEFLWANLFSVTFRKRNELCGKCVRQIRHNLTNAEIRRHARLRLH